MLPGYNHNVQYKGRIYHIQTEDSGVQNPHIITLLYYGGNIIARKKTSYEDILNSDKLNQVVKEMMQEQHKAMLRDLKNGVFDDRIKMLVEQPVQPSAPISPTPTPPPPQAKPSAPTVSSSQPRVPPKVPPPPPPRPGIPPKPAAPSPQSSQARQGVVSSRPAPQPQQAPPPPPKATPPPPPPPPSTSKLIELSDDIELKDEDIFGADLISDKSLDEVILSYLAQNIEEE